MTYNIGGFSGETYAVFCQWLTTQQDFDIVMVQEIHWGLGKTEGRWQVGSWTAVVSPDPKCRYAGVAIFVSGRIASDSQIGYNICLPGRILHVKCEGQRTHLDLITGYQWVWQDRQREQVQKQRAHFWTKLSQLLHTLPARNLLLIGADFNSKLRPLTGLVGRGLMRSNQGSDVDLEAVLQTHNLVMANTWSSSTATRAHTFHNGDTRSQLDFLATRRLTVDALAKMSAPFSLDLVPWRKGPKHRPVQGSFRWIAGWCCAKKSVLVNQYSKQDLREHLQNHTDKAQQLKTRVLQALNTCWVGKDLRMLNQEVLKACQELFPARKQQQLKPRELPQVVSAIHDMWEAHSALQQPLPFGQFSRASTAVARRLKFQRACRELRNQSRQARKHWMVDKLQLAEQAAARNDYAELYRIINQVAPKKRRERVRIRSKTGDLLTKGQEFSEIYEFFSVAIQSAGEDAATKPCCLPLSSEEIETALAQLKKGKAVPASSVPAEIWQLCPTEYACKLSGLLQTCAQAGAPVPPEVSHCELSLLPKPGKDTRRPCDLRPLGLQGPSSKIYALAVRGRLMEYIQPLLDRVPQYAYVPGKNIDQAIVRVAKHCAAIRHRLREGVKTVHQRRLGHKAGVCYGGIMLSIDLSRAFDSLTRQALSAALDLAEVPVALRDAVLSLHNACRYTVKHHTHRADFPMEVGVRQGCTLAPALYSLFTALFWQQLSACTSIEWATRCITMFADDKHMYWTIESVEDLNFVCSCVQQTFRLLRSYGMKVNADKSRMVVALRGSAGKRWQRRHTVVTTMGQSLNVGTPHSPLLIPMVHTLVYLGVVASYGGFELHTLQHRQKAAAQNRHRLLKFLHGKMLSLQERLRLYNACVRSALFYGLHVIGLTGTTARMLEATDMRAVRAIAKSPVHLTRESNAMLCKRLHIDLPVAAVKQRMQRKVREAQPDSDWYADLCNVLEPLQAFTASPEKVHLSAESFPGVACPDCGIYLTTHRHMLSHRARKHGYRVPRTVKQMGTGHMQHSVDGMPHCKHCNKIFTRVEGFKKHLRGACPVLFASQPAATEGSVAAVVVQVAPQQEELRMGSKDRAPQTDSSKPLIEDDAFRALSKKGWREVLRDPQYKKILGVHCIFCGQWCAPSGFKQHIRLMHPKAHHLHEQAADRCNSLGLSAQSPCCYWGVSHQQPRRHLVSCSAVYQASLANLYILQPPQLSASQASDHGGSCSGGKAGHCGGLRGRKRGCGDEGGPSGASAGDSGGPVEGLEQGGKGRFQVAEKGEGRLWRQRKLVFLAALEAKVSREGERAGDDPGAGCSHSGPHRSHDTDEPSARGGTGSAEAGYGVYVVRGHGGLQLPGQASRSRGSVARTICQSEGHHGPQGGPHVGTLHDATYESGGASAERGTPGPAHQGRLDFRRQDSLGSGVPLLRVESGREEGDSVHRAAASTDRGAGNAGHPGAVPNDPGCADSVQGHSAVERGASLGGDAFPEIPQPSSRGGSSLLSQFHPPVGKLGDETAGHSTSSGKGTAQQHQQGARRRLSCYELLRLGAASRVAEAEASQPGSTGEREVIDLGR